MLLLILTVVLLSASPPEESGRPVVRQTPSADVREAAQKAGFGAFADRVAEAARPTVFIRPAGPGMPSALGTSRLGGDPDLPAGTKWPRCKARPQSFLAQVRARDLPPGAQELRRHGGVLLFFTHVEFAPGVDDYGLWAGDCSAVIHARTGARLERAAAPRGGRVMRLRPARIGFAQRPDVPPIGLDVDHLMPPLQDITPPNWEAWFEFRFTLNGRPRLDHRLLGYGDAPNGGNACSARAERSTQTWRHLLSFGPDEERGFEVADAGALQLLISPADLRAGRFDRVCGVFDSG